MASLAQDQKRLKKWIGQIITRPDWESRVQQPWAILCRATQNLHWRGTKGLSVYMRFLGQSPYVGEGEHTGDTYSIHYLEKQIEKGEWVLIPKEKSDLFRLKYKLPI